MIHTRFILIEPSHAGNVGATARAMKVMGFSDLVLVRPRWENVLRKEETIQRSSGALDVLSQARIVQHLDDALDGMTHLCATAMTPRDFGPPTQEPKAHLESFAKDIGLCRGGLEGLGGMSALSGAEQRGIAFLFGSERYGMANEDVYKCQVALRISTNPEFGSLNLAAAVQLIAYEWRSCLGGFGPSKSPADVNRAKDTQPPQLADASQISGLLLHWQQALVHIGFLDPDAPKKLMPRLNQLFNKAQMTMEEIHIFRGIAKTMLQLVQRQGSSLVEKEKSTLDDAVQTQALKKDRL